MASPKYHEPLPAEELKAKVLEDKSAYRKHVANLPVAEKLRMLEEMRETTRALLPVREANRAKIRRDAASREQK
jgi:hypothetical protein